MYRFEPKIGTEAMGVVATSSALLLEDTIVGERGELAVIVPVGSAAKERSNMVRVRIVERQVVVE